MNWITIVWPMIISACLTLAVVHALIWAKNRKDRAHLAFALLAVCVGAMAGFELALLRAETAAEFGVLLRWSLVAVFGGVVGIVWFVPAYFGTGRAWLMHVTWLSRFAGLVINFCVSPNLIYQEITGVRQAHLLGAPVVVADGVTSRWLWLDELSVVLLVVFVADASITLWKRGEPVGRRRAVVVGGSLAVFVLIAGTVVSLTHEKIIDFPYFVGMPFMIMVGAMGYELSHDVLRAAQLTGALRESEQRMELAADAANLGLWVWEIPGDTIWGTDKAREFFGFTPTEPVSFARFERAVHPDDRDRVRQAVQQALAGTGEYEMEYRAVTPDGQTRWIGARGRVEFDERRQPVRMRGTLIDLSRRKNAEAEAKQSRDALAHATRVATMGELSASLAHELNQPLSAILTNAQAAQRFLAAGTPDLEEIRAALRDIAEDGNRAGEIIRRLRAMVKRTPVELLSLDIDRVVRDVTGLLHGDAALRNVTVKLELTAGLPAVRGDQIQLQQVILNLLLNAFDAINGVPDRTVSVRTMLVDGQRIRVSVRDSGTGLRRELLDRLFEPFHTTKPHGLGMGLTISRSIIEAHQGRLWGENNPDGGATFHFEIPVSTTT